MTTNGILQIALYLAGLLALVRPLGSYMAKVYQGEWLWLGPGEKMIYRLLGTRPEDEMPWKGYAASCLLFEFASLLLLHLMMRLKDALPLNPQSFPAVPEDLAFNTAVSFITTTNWQAYGGESTMSYLTQVAGLAVQNFVSAAQGMAVLVALIRGFTRQSARTIGNFWVDLTRSVLYILLPLSVIVAVFLVSQGVVQSFSPYKSVQLVQPITYEKPKLDEKGNPIRDANGAGYHTWWHNAPQPINAVKAARGGQPRWLASEGRLTTACVSGATPAGCWALDVRTSECGFLTARGRSP